MTARSSSRLTVLLGLLFLGQLWTSPRSMATHLDDYVSAPDPSTTYALVGTHVEATHTLYVIELTSQTWRSLSEVNRVLWKHWLLVIVPVNVRTDMNRAFLFIDGGSNGGSPPTTIEPQLAAIALGTRSILADLRMVPNEPLTFAGETQSRTEDAIIAYSLDRYLTTGDPTWPVLLPMVKSAVKAMDTLQSFVPTVVSGLTLDTFVVAGASKRGWTTWLTAAVDPRVEMIIPVVIDVLNLDVQMRHHHAAYGFFSSAIHDYQDLNVFERMDSPEGQALLQFVDPYEYRSRYASIPKLGINSTGDQFFLPDSAQFYFNDLPGVKYLNYIPNTDHSTESQDAAYSALKFYEALIYGWHRPQFTWDLQGDGQYTLTAADPPTHVFLWQASNPTARDFRLETIGEAWTSSELSPQSPGVYTGRVPRPASGWTAFMLQLLYGDPGNYLFEFTTEVRVVPDCYPNTPCPAEPTATPTSAPTATPSATPTPSPTASPTPAPTATRGWTEIQAESPVSGLLLYGDRLDHEMAGLPALTEPATTQVLGHFHCSAQWFTGLVLANPDPTQTATGHVTFVSSQGIILKTVDVPLVPGGKMARLLTDSSLLGPVSGTGWIRVESPLPLCAFLLYGDKIHGGMAALPACQMASSMVLPHMHHSNRWWTGLSITNPHPLPVVVDLLACGDDGIPLSHVQQSIPAHSKFSGTVDQIFGLAPGMRGWVQVTTEGETVGAMSVYGDKMSTPQQIGAMIGVSPSKDFYLSAFLESSTWWTGVSVVNPNDQPVLLTLKAQSPLGTLLDTRELTLGPMCRQVSMASSLFQLDSPSEGWLEAHASLPVSGCQVLQASDVQTEAWGLAAIEPQAAAQVLYFPHYDIQSRWWTWLALGNPNDSIPALPKVISSSESGAASGWSVPWIPANGQILRSVQELWR